MRVGGPYWDTARLAWPRGSTPLATEQYERERVRYERGVPIVQLDAAELPSIVEALDRAPSRYDAETGEVVRPHVTRVDAAVDFLVETRQLEPLALAREVIARGLKSPMPELDPKARRWTAHGRPYGAGATVYVGTRNSRKTVRIYVKTAHPDGWSTPALRWSALPEDASKMVVRVEVEVHRHALRGIDPVQLSPSETWKHARAVLEGLTVEYMGLTAAMLASVDVPERFIAPETDAAARSYDGMLLSALTDMARALARLRVLAPAAESEEARMADWCAQALANNPEVVKSRTKDCRKRLRAAIRASPGLAERLRGEGVDIPE